MNKDEVKTFLETEIGKTRATELLMQSKVKTFFVNNKIEILMGLLCLVIVFAIYMMWPVKKSDTTIDILNTVKKQMEEQFNKQLKDKDTAIKDKDAAIQEAVNRLIISEGKYQSLVARYSILQKEKINVKAPVTNAETRNRFTILTYIPLPVK